MTTQTQALATEFATRLRAEIGDDCYAEVVHLNGTPDYQGGACASHDFCDANMVMDAAFTDVVGHEAGACDSAPADLELWNAAWDLFHAACRA